MDVFKPGTSHALDSLPTKLAWHNDSMAKPSTQSIPSTCGISSLYTPYLSVVLLTETLICSVVFGDCALNLHPMLTSTPGKIKGNFKYHKYIICMCVCVYLYELDQFLGLYSLFYLARSSCA